MKRPRISPRHIAAGAVAVAAVGALYGTAIASWTSSGTGSGSAKAATSQSVTVNAAVGGADLYPGFTGGDLHFTLTNPNPYAVTFTSMTPGTVVSSDPTNCPGSNVTATSKSGLSLSVAAGATSGTLSIVDVVSMTASAPNGCQGVVFTIPVTLTGAQS